MEPFDEFTTRKKRLTDLCEAGINPFPSTTDRSHTLQQFLTKFAELQDSKEIVTVVGRVFAIRRHGGSTFLTLSDGTAKVQIYFKKDALGDEAYELLEKIDMGDFLQIAGSAFVTRRGEYSVEATKPIRFLSKALLPLPEKWHGLVNIETRLRKRYLDMLLNDEVRDRLVKRSRIITAMRKFLDSKGFLEVETPTLQPIYGGGFARPFKTHHNALASDFYLRISDEMYLKRLLVAGLDGVYEITKVFRNEGIDRDHNPEFTMFELQAAYRDYEWGMDFYEELYEHVVEEVCGSTDVTYQDQVLHFAKPWKRMRLVEALQEVAKLDVSEWTTVEQGKAVLQKLLPAKMVEKLDQFNTIGELVAFAFEELVEEKLLQPTIIYDYPVEVSPLAKKAKDQRYAERFEAFVMGSEVGNNYSELNDPIDLEKRFIEEKKKEAAGFEEAHQTDTAYLEAIQHGMPPACGLAVGIDRMVMFLTNAKNIKDVILFPTLKPESKDSSNAEKN